MAQSGWNPQPCHIRDIHGEILCVLDRHLADFTPCSYPISVKHAMQYIREFVFQCEFSDIVLANIIAAHAIQRSYNLLFDTNIGYKSYTIPLEKYH